MIARIRHAVLAAVVLAATPLASTAQESWTSNDPVLRAIWSEGMERSHLAPMAQVLMDSIGPRLTGSPGQLAAHEWAAAQFRGWGIEARNETYGSWVGWRRGTAHVDLVQPRLRSLEARLLAWSPGTAGAVTAEVVAIPEFADTAAARRWLGTVRGKFVLGAAEPVTCRPIENWQNWAQPQTLGRLAQDAARADSSWRRRLARLRVQPGELESLLARSGAAGVVTSEWTGGWGTQRVHDALGVPVPVLDVTCEDYGLLHRLASRGQGPVIRVDAQAEFTGAAPAMNTVATIPGRALRNEYVVLSAHFDSWDAASGATDNGTGTLVMMEAARILRAVYPNPKRTIVIGLWGGEEQGLNGSRAFAEDNPGIIEGLQALLNQDTGTGRMDRISLQGFTQAEPFFRRWFSRVPPMLADSIKLDAPGLPSGGSSDHSSFVCRGAPGFWLLSTSWDYGTYTWHTDRDTYDKIVFSDLRRNAVLLAMLAYQAAEDERIPRTRLTEFPPNAAGQPGSWPSCRPAQRALN
ncbi:M20/M25/M40 family metallo-hydrolase [Longimicrobium sp.]|jgi:hypothetical protein|uniref:M20/M25/M40 family metallo-hydrolase n=1 Tax=Longimicrobium sp. TaxID=2029185 RepID=UPI002F95526E